MQARLYNKLRKENPWKLDKVIMATKNILKMPLPRKRRQWFEISCAINEPPLSFRFSALIGPVAESGLKEQLIIYF